VGFREPCFVALDRIESDGENEVGCTDRLEDVVINAHSGRDAAEEWMIFAYNSLGFRRDEKGRLKVIDEGAYGGWCRETDENERASGLFEGPDHRVQGTAGLVCRRNWSLGGK